MKFVTDIPCPFGCVASTVTMVDNKWEMKKPVYTCNGCEAQWQYELMTRIVLIDSGKNEIPDMSEQDWDLIDKLIKEK